MQWTHRRAARCLFVYVLWGLGLLWACGVGACQPNERAYSGVEGARTDAAPQPPPRYDQGDGVPDRDPRAGLPPPILTIDVVEPQPSPQATSEAYAALVTARDRALSPLLVGARDVLRVGADRRALLAPSGVKVVNPATCIGDMAAFHGCLKEGELALTFDDGPHPEYTLKILDILDLYRVKATFFIVGKQARKYPLIVQEVLRRGHTVATHTQNHAYLKGLTYKAALTEIQSGYDSALAAAGKASAQISPLFRFPGGRSYATGPLQAAITRAGMIALYWNIDGNDTQARAAARRQLTARGLDAKDERLVHKLAAAEVYQKVIADIQSQRRGIILLHDMHAHTVLALPSILEEFAFPRDLAATASDIGVTAFLTMQFVPPSHKTRPSHVSASLSRAGNIRGDDNPTNVVAEPPPP
jgi:peptidoglycan/xylan/chitin deacetylase (PgdA/CDA1 family)